jgi:small subunit ribosomal protein S2
MQPYIFGTRSGIHIIDLEQTITHLRRACAITREIAYRGGLIVFVGTRPYTKDICHQAATKSSSYYVQKWVGGTITNRQEILGKYSKMSLNQITTGVSNEFRQSLEHATRVAKPDLVVLLSTVDNRNAVLECKQEMVPTVGIVDTDADPQSVTYPIPANDDSALSVGLVANLLSWAAQEGRMRRLATIKNVSTDP